MQNETHLAALLMNFSACPLYSLRAAVIVTVAFAVLARLLRGVTTSGAVAGAAVCFALYASAGPPAFEVLVLVFILTWLATHFGYQRKLALGTAEKRDGRNAFQVLANLGVAAICILLYARSANAAFLLASCAALSEAAADTISSELGKASGKTPRLITNWKEVPIGTNGGITLIGTLAGIAGAAIVSWGCIVTGLLPWKWLAISLGTATLGMMVDSFLGAELEERGLLNNDAVNLLSTLFSAAFAFLLGIYLR